MKNFEKPNICRECGELLVTSEEKQAGVCLQCDWEACYRFLPPEKQNVPVLDQAAMRLEKIAIMLAEVNRLSRELVRKELGVNFSIEEVDDEKSRN